MGSIPKISGVVVVSILATGAILNLLGSGKMGTFPQSLAKYITNGYGV